jgi:16S rRNA (uracil1498-N3)-methyltransferase
VRRFFVEPGELVLGQSVELGGDEFHHLKNVSRLEEGERVELLDGRGKIAVALIASMQKKSATLTIESIENLPPLPKPEIEIVLCVPRFQKMDLIIQKSVELGAAEITPVVSERSFLKTITKELTSKHARWEKIAAEACKQSGRAWPLRLRVASTLTEKIKEADPAYSLFLYEGESATDIKTALSSLKGSVDKLAIFIGAEGGFSPEEVQAFVEKGMKPVTMGPLVLRVETACIAILSVIQYAFGVMR